MKNELMKSMDKKFSSCLGFSIYPSNSLEDSLTWIEAYAKAGFSFAFSSLNIPEATKDTSHLKKLLQSCQRYKISVFVDINRQSLDNYGKDGLAELGIEALRFDDGISVQEMAELSKYFFIVLNASTLTKELIVDLMEVGVDLKQVIACHNYYPKPYTGLSLNKVKEMNEQLHQYDIPVISFIAGQEKRLPIFEGLPTIESHRQMPPLLAALESLIAGKSDYICVGDNALSENSLTLLYYLSQGVVPLLTNLPENLKGIIFENRQDNSDYVIRAATSRQQLKNLTFEGETKLRHRGDIVIANEKFLRYQNELEICLTDLPQDERQTIVGQIQPDSLGLLNFIQGGSKFTFI